MQSEFASSRNINKTRNISIFVEKIEIMKIELIESIRFYIKIGIYVDGKLIIKIEFLICLPISRT